MQFKNVQDIFKKHEQRLTASGVRFRDPISIVFAFDECRNMLNGDRRRPSDDGYAGSTLQACRHGTRYFSGNGMAIFADTTSKISSLAPPTSLDPSLRMLSGVDLFPPNLYIPLVDLIKCEDVLPASVLPQGEFIISHLDKNFCDLKINIANELNLSRAGFVTAIEEDFFSSNPKAVTFNAAYEDLIKVIMVKLGIDPDLKSSTTYDRRVYVGLASVLFGIQFANRTTNDFLLSSFLGLACGLSDDRSRMVIKYLGEPPLSEAVCRFASSMISEDKFSRSAFDTAILKVLEEISEHELIPVGVGPIGEYVGNVIVMAAMLKANPKRRRFSDPFPFGLFLKTLLPAWLYDDVRKAAKEAGFDWEALLNGFVCCTSTWRLEHDIDTAGLLEGFERRALLSLRNYYPALDVIIPMVSNQRLDVGTGSCVVASKDNIEAIGIQIKCYNSRTIPSPSSLMKSMHSKLASQGIKSRLLIVLQVGDYPLSLAHEDFFVTEEYIGVALTLDHMHDKNNPTESVLSEEAVQALKTLASFEKRTENNVIDYYKFVTEDCVSIPADLRNDNRESVQYIARHMCPSYKPSSLMLSSSSSGSIGEVENPSHAIEQTSMQSQNVIVATRTNGEPPVKKFRRSNNN